MGQIYRKPKLFSRHKKKKNIIKREAQIALAPPQLDDARDAHKNMNITPLRFTYKIDPKKKMREPTEDGSKELVIDQNYDIIKKQMKVLARSGKIVIKYVRNNPPGKRYYPLSESKIAKGDTIEGYTVTGTTFHDYTNKINAQKKEALEDSWRKK
jgi:hypothetical protein